MREAKISGVIYILLAGICWGFMGVPVRMLGEVGLASLDICFIRAFITFLVMLIGLFIFDRSAFRIKIRDIWCFAGTGALSVAFFNFCYFKTMTLTSLSVAAVFLYTAPAFVMVMSAFLFKEKLTVQKLAALGLAFLGCVFVSGIIGGAGALSAAGILCGLGAGFGYALYSIFGRFAINRGYSSLTISFYTFLFAALATFFLTDAGRVVAAVTGNGSLFMKTVFWVLVVTLVPYLSYTKGLNSVENGKASVIASIEPVVATVVGVLLYKEEMQIWNVLGICLVLGSILLIYSKREKSDE
ncbi:MAG: EamA family transporter [Lachnospiraceae bacterium]|nr:EamA family transporter [Lachnospiraceae bacterium]